MEGSPRSTHEISMPNMTGRPGCRTMEMNGGSSAPYLVCTPCIPSFVLCLIGVETEGLLGYKGRARIISNVRWNLRPVIFGVENSSLSVFFPCALCGYALCTLPTRGHLEAGEALRGPGEALRGRVCPPLVSQRSRKRRWASQRPPKVRCAILSFLYEVKLFFSLGLWPPKLPKITRNRPKSPEKGPSKLAKTALKLKVALKGPPLIPLKKAGRLHT